MSCALFPHLYFPACLATMSVTATATVVAVTTIAAWCTLEWWLDKTIMNQDFHSLIARAWLFSQALIQKMTSCELLILSACHRFLLTLSLTIAYLIDRVLPSFKDSRPIISASRIVVDWPSYFFFVLWVDSFLGESHLLIGAFTTSNLLVRCCSVFFATVP